MSDDASVVWLSPDGAAAEGAGTEAGRALAEWGHARGVRLVAVDDASSASGLEVDVSIGERVEKEIQRAREAISGLDADAAERALARADAVLRDHPEVPQAAWLRAEVERSWAARFARVDPRDDARAAEHWKNAYALDGGRVAGVGESDLGPRKRVATSFVVGGTRGRPVVVRLDGVDLGAGTTSDGRVTYTTEAAPAEHQLVAYADGEAVFASWVTIAPGSPPVEIELATGGVCARSAFTKVTREDMQVRAAGVTCPRWVAAVPMDRAGSVLVARCERDSCGPLLEWRVERWGDSGPPQSFGRRTVWPGWATWTILGVGAATATAISLVATGVFESRPVETRFVSGGARVE